MPRDLFEEAGITQGVSSQPRDLFAEAGITPDTTSSIPVKQQQPTASVMEKMWAPYLSLGRGLLNATGSVTEPIAQMASGYVAKPVSEIAGMAAIGSELVNPQGGDPEAFKRYVAERLTLQPRTEGGKFVSQKILAPIGSLGSLIESGAEKIGEGAKYVTGSDIAASGIKEAALQGVGFLGVKGAPKAASAIKAQNAMKAAALKEQQAFAAQTNAIRASGQKIGLIAPAEGALKEGISKMGGADAYLSIKNREAGTWAIAKDVGLGKGAISDADLARRVAELSKDYANVEKAIGKNVGITLDFKAGVNEMLVPMKARFAQDPKAFSALSPSIELLEQQLKPVVNERGRLIKQNVSTPIVMEKIKQLRSDARKYAKDATGDPAKAKIAETNYELAGLYEDLIEKSLGNKTALLEKFRDSRKKLSQIHVLDAARMDDGLLDLQKLAGVIGRYKTNQKMVTGNLKTVSEFANTFKEVTKPIVKSSLPSPTRWETVAAMGGVGGAVAAGNPAPLIFATPMMTRAIVPALAERGLLQGAPASYDLSLLRRTAPYAVETGMLSGAFSPYIKDMEYQE